MKAAAGAPHALPLGGRWPSLRAGDTDLVCWAFQPTRLLQPFLHVASVSAFISIREFFRTQIMLDVVCVCVYFKYILGAPSHELKDGALVFFMAA